MSAEWSRHHRENQVFLYYFHNQDSLIEMMILSEMRLYMTKYVHRLFKNYVRRGIFNYL